MADASAEHPGLLRIRPATQADVRVLAEFNVAMARETEGRELDPAIVESGVRGLLARPGAGFYLVAEQQAELLGTLMVTSEWSDWRDGFFWWIQSVYVRPGYRRQGVFRRLHQEVRRRARADSEVRGLRLYMEHDNRVARHTYLALGMCETGYRVFEEEFAAGGDGA